MEAVGSQRSKYGKIARFQPGGLPFQTRDAQPIEGRSMPSAVRCAPEES